MRLKCCAVVILLSLLSLSASSQVDLSFPVEKYKLDNGLTVLLYEDHSAPVVSYHTWVRVGSKDEEKGFTGIAHLFEHLMFKGSKKISNKEYERTLQENGAVNNAFTSRDYTGYYVNAPSDKLETIMALEADRFQNLNLTEENLLSEREVVKEERRFRVENRVQGLVFEHINELAYTASAYRWPVIGYIADLNNISLSKAQEFYKTYYSPNNAVLVIGGDFDKKKVKKLIESYYGDFKSQTINRPAQIAEPVQKKPREDIFYKDVQSDYLSLSFIVPDQNSPDLAAVELLSEILGSGDSSRLYKKLVYQMQIATGVYTFVMANLHSSLFQIHVMLKPSKNKKEADAIKNKALSVIWSELFKLRSYDVTAQDLLKAQNKVIKSHVDALKSIDGKTYALSMNEAVLGDYSRLFTDLENYKRVQVKDIRKAAERFLTQNKSNTVVARPNSYKEVKK